MTANYTLYGAEFSLYSGKARAYLKYKNIPFDEVLSTIVVYRKIIIPKTGVRFIPVVKTPEGEYLQDTTHIIDHLESQHTQKSVYPVTPKQRLVSMLLELYGDEWLLIPAMHYRWNTDNFPFIYQEFGRIVSPRLPTFIRAFVGKKIGLRFKGFVPLLGITEKTIPAIERWYEERFLPDLNYHFSKYPFLLGDVPSIGDFGFMGPLYAHLYRDPYPGQLMKRLAPHVASWVERMNNASNVSGEFLPNDEIPETLLPILENLFTEQWPVLEDTANKLSAWYDEQTETSPSDEPRAIPRSLGRHRFHINGVEEQRLVLPYTQWMMQRPLEYYQSLSPEEKEYVDPWLQQVQGFDAMQFALKQQVTKVNNRFVL